MVKNTGILILIWLCICNNLLAQTCGINKIDTNMQTVVFINGIQNTRTEACQSSLKLVNNLGGDKKYNYDYFHNPKDPLLADQYELREQSAASDASMQRVQLTTANLIGIENSKKLTYYFELGKNYLEAKYNDTFGSRVKTNKDFIAAIKSLLIKPKTSVVIVAHSQGNFYTESAISQIIKEGRADLTTRIRVVGAASVAGTTPNNRYLTHKQDLAVYTALPVLIADKYLRTFRSLVSNADACVMPCAAANSIDYSKLVTATEIPATATTAKQAADKVLHSFEQVYLNPKIGSFATKEPFPVTLSKLIKTSLREMDVNVVGVLNDTGNQQCYKFDSSGGSLLASCDDPLVQLLPAINDGSRGRDYAELNNAAQDLDGKGGFSYTKICNNGQAADTPNSKCLPSAQRGTAPTDWACTRDNISGLIWEIRKNNGAWSQAGEEGVNSYTHFSEYIRSGNIYAKNINYGKIGDAAHYLKTVNTTGLCGLKNWSIPNIDELLSLSGNRAFRNASGQIPEYHTEFFPTLHEDYRDFFTIAHDVSVPLFSSYSYNDYNSTWFYRDKELTQTTSNPIVYLAPNNWRAAIILVNYKNTKLSSAINFIRHGNEYHDLYNKLAWYQCPLGMSGESCLGVPTYDKFGSDFANYWSNFVASTGKNYRIANFKELNTLIDRSNPEYRLNKTYFNLYKRLKDSNAIAFSLSDGYLSRVELTTGEMQQAGGSHLMLVRNLE